jgi:hypothetical protein
MATEVRMAADVERGTLPRICGLCKQTALYVVLRDANPEYLCSEHLSKRAEEDEELRIAAKLPAPE